MCEVRARSKTDHQSDNRLHVGPPVGPWPTPPPTNPPKPPHITNLYLRQKKRGGGVTKGA